jgi:hypothetical protein
MIVFYLQKFYPSRLLRVRNKFFVLLLGLIFKYFLGLWSWNFSNITSLIDQIIIVLLYWDIGLELVHCC